MLLYCWCCLPAEEDGAGWGESRPYEGVLLLEGIGGVGFGLGAYCEAGAGEGCFCSGSANLDCFVARAQISLCVSCRVGQYAPWELVGVVGPVVRHGG